MKTGLKKLVAGASIVALVAMNALSVNGAALNGATATYDDGTDTITVTMWGKDFTLDNISVVSVKTSAGVDVAGVDVADVTEANGNFTITDAINLDWLAADIYSVSFSTVNWDFGATVAYVGNANVVNVSAVVLPILSMSLSANTLDFGELAIWANSVDLDVTTASNAKDGITVSVASLWLATGNASSDYHIWALARVDSIGTTGTDSYEISSDGWLALQDVAATQNVLVTTDVATSNSTTNVELTATIDAQTESGNYNDTLTFTVTGNF